VSAFFEERSRQQYMPYNMQINGKVFLQLSRGLFHFSSFIINFYFLFMHALRAYALNTELHA